ncbi:MAG TPA: hypothetical protein VG734_12270 [Lacunisphaera sp.]|nr:hypothetical protein [Lacunisphaera sp.]
MKNLSLLAVVSLAVAPLFAADTSAPAAVPAAQLPVADHMVFLGELPESAELMKNAAANGLTITRLDRTSDRVVVTYSYPGGQTATMGYALLSSVGNNDWVAPKQVVRETRVVEQRPVTVVTREPEVVYYEPSYPRTRVVYRDPVDDFWLPLTLGVGIGWVTGHNHGYYHSNWSHGWSYGHGRGGWRH